MDEQEIKEMFRSMMQRQLLSTALIKAALVSHGAGHPLMLALFEVQEEVHRDIRESLRTLPGADPSLLEAFDEQLFQHRLTMLLILNSIVPAKD